MVDDKRGKAPLLYYVDDEERAALERSAEDVRHGRFATDEEVAALFAKARKLLPEK